MKKLFIILMILAMAGVAWGGEKTCIFDSDGECSCTELGGGCGITYRAPIWECEPEIYNNIKNQIKKFDDLVKELRENGLIGREDKERIIGVHLNGFIHPIVPGLTKDWVEAEIKAINDKLDLIIKHLSLEIKEVPEKVIESHFELVPRQTGHIKWTLSIDKEGK